MGSGTTLDAALSSIDSDTGGTAKVFRAWFFQHLATVNGQRDWSGFDHSPAIARAHGFQVIPVLANQWGSCEASTGYKTEQWYQSGYQQADPSGIVSYRLWVQEVVARYRSDPTIAMWMLMNEA